MMQHLQTSEVLFGAKKAANSRLFAMVEDARKEEGLAVNRLALDSAKQFVRMLPDDLPLPEFATEPDGAISMDWAPARSRRISISFGPRPRVAYAWLDGTDKGHGVERFDGEVLPRRLLAVIRSIVVA